MNRIRNLDLHVRSAVPASAELHVSVTPERLTAATELRGRLLGPRCRFAATVEVAYHLRPLPPQPDTVAARVVIPEASLWEPATPFLYEGPVELWQDDACCDRRPVRCGLRTLALTRRGLHVNGRPLALRGRAVVACPEGDALDLRRAGFNLLLAPAAEAIWDMADRIGFLVLARLPADPPAELLAAFKSHPCSFGWLIAAGAAPPQALPPEALLGVEAGGACPGASFVVGTAEASAMAGLPLLRLGPSGEAVPAPALGWVE
jgi:hypothetical protein